MQRDCTTRLDETAQQDTTRLQKVVNETQRQNSSKNHQKSSKNQQKFVKNRQKSEKTTPSPSSPFGTASSSSPSSSSLPPPCKYGESLIHISTIKGRYAKLKNSKNCVFESSHASTMIKRQKGNNNNEGAMKS